MHARVSEDLDLSMEQGFEVLTQTDEIEQRTSSLHVDKEVDVAAPVVLAEVRAAVAAFVERYNQCWRLEKLAYRTPLEAREEYELRHAA